MSEMPKANILVVDDTRANLRFLVEILTQQGYAVRPALDGHTALSSARARPPDLILLDIMMPDIDGYEVCVRLKADTATRDIPIIFLSALNEVVDKIKAFEIGGVDYITKPFQVEEVLARVETHLALRNLQRRLQEKNEELVRVNEALTREIAERQQAQMALQQYARELEASNAELDAFAHTVAHDLKTPLTALIGFSSLLEQRFERLALERVRERLHMITETGHKMTDIINELLLLSSVRKVEEVQVAPLDMGGIIEGVCNRLAGVINTCGGEVCVPDAWPKVVSYAPWVEEVWVNYISNAFKYGGRPEDQVPPLVTLGFTDAQDFAVKGAKDANPDHPHSSLRGLTLDSQVVFWVKDNGIGLTKEQQARLFAQFTRLHEVRVEGHGLGLSIVQRIVEKLGGVVGVKSVVGQGSTFWFTLPAF